MIDIGKKHGDFILCQVLPAIAQQSADSHSDMQEVALAVFMSLGTILLNLGFTADSLLAAIKASALTTHDAPGGLQ